MELPGVTLYVSHGAQLYTTIQRLASLRLVVLVLVAVRRAGTVLLNPTQAIRANALRALRQLNTIIRKPLAFTNAKTHAHG